jgi:hypothetical protein
MSPGRIKTFLEETPFQPFTVHTGDGKSVNVLSREFAFLHPGGRTLLIAVPMRAKAKEEADFKEHHIDVFLITKVTTPADRHKRNGHKRTH